MAAVAEADPPAVRVLAFAGWDPSGAAGLARDLATCAHFGVDAAGVVTAIVPQDDSGVRAVEPLPVEILSAQTGVLPWSGTAVWKVGLLPTSEHLDLVLNLHREHGRPPLIVDPVIWSGSGSRLPQPDALARLRKLAAQATTLTPNLREARALAGSDDGARDLVRALAPEGGWCVVTGGDEPTDPVVDWASDGDQVLGFERPRVDAGWVRGTGCAMSTAIACRLALGSSLPEAIGEAGDWVAGQLTLVPRAPAGRAGRMP